MIQKERIEKSNSKKIVDGKYVLFWMQGAQRVTYNHAFEFAKEIANNQGIPLLVYFGLTADYPEANLRHYKFMMEGLKEVKDHFQKNNINFIILNIAPDKGAIDLARDASVLVTDKGYDNIQKKWRKNVADNIDCSMYEVDTNLVVPIDYASEKKEYMAWTLRKKLDSKKYKFLVPVEYSDLENKENIVIERKDKIENIQEALKNLDLDRNVKGVDSFIGGTSKAKSYLKEFISSKLDRYSDEGNDPTKNLVSFLSPYLHFGQISPIYIYLQVHNAEVSSNSKDDFLEQLLVRRELAFNFVYYNPDYRDLYKSIPDWAKQTLEEHKEDKREYLYSKKEFEEANTHDKYWNAAQNQMLKTGLMHGYMRMYWGKKILEWSQNPEEAYEIALYLNNKYALDGRDPNSYTGVAWCFGQHDRAWKERKIFGKTRYMNANGLKRKFDIEKYIEKWVK
ncbi:MAG: deoxyribodipyrimidine photo-lyase [Fusobacteriota bacterium]